MKLQFQICATFVTALTATLAHASIVSTLNPVADAFVTSGQPANNYGGAGALSAAAAGLPTGEFQSVMRFDTTAAKANFDAAFGAGLWFVQDVSLTLTATGPNNAIFNASAAGQFNASWMQNDTWVEGTGTPGAPTTTGITFNTLPSFLSGGDAGLGTFSFPGGTSGALSYILGLPSGLQNDILGGSLLSMRLFAADSAVSYLFISRNNPTIASRPLLTITAAPEPASAELIMPGVVGCLTLRRRRRK